MPLASLLADAIAFGTLATTSGFTELVGDDFTFSPCSCHLAEEYPA